MLWTLCPCMCVKTADAGVFLWVRVFPAASWIFWFSARLLFIHLIFSHHGKLTTATFCPRGTGKSNHMCEYLTNPQIAGRRDEVQRGDTCGTAGAFRPLVYITKTTFESSQAFLLLELLIKRHNNLRFLFYGSSLKQDFGFSCFRSDH